MAYGYNPLDYRPDFNASARLAAGIGSGVVTALGGAAQIVQAAGQSKENRDNLAARDTAVQQAKQLTTGLTPEELSRANLTSVDSLVPQPTENEDSGAYQNRVQQWLHTAVIKPVDDIKGEAYLVQKLKEAASTSATSDQITQLQTDPRMAQHQGLLKELKDAAVARESGAKTALGNQATSQIVGAMQVRPSTPADGSVASDGSGLGGATRPTIVNKVTPEGGTMPTLTGANPRPATGLSPEDATFFSNSLQGKGIITLDNAQQIEKAGAPIAEATLTGKQVAGMQNQPSNAAAYGAAMGSGGGKPLTKPAEGMYEAIKADNTNQFKLQEAEARASLAEARLNQDPSKDPIDWWEKKRTIAGGIVSSLNGQIKSIQTTLANPQTATSDQAPALKEQLKQLQTVDLPKAQSDYQVENAGYLITAAQQKTDLQRTAWQAHMNEVVDPIVQKVQATSMATIQGDGRNAPGLPKTGAANKSAADSAIADATKGMPTTSAQAITREVYSRLGIGEGTARTSRTTNKSGTPADATSERQGAIQYLKDNKMSDLINNEEAIAAAKEEVRRNQFSIARK